MAKEYQIATSNDYGELEDTVTAMLNEGWELVGGVAVAQSDIFVDLGSTEKFETTYFQAMRKDG